MSANAVSIKSAAQALLIRLVSGSFVLSSPEELLFNSDSSKINSIEADYDGRSQAFKMRFRYGRKNIMIPITCRTRQAGGWSGKSLFITTSGVKVLNWY